MRILSAAVPLLLTIVVSLPSGATCTLGFLSPSRYGAGEKAGDIAAGDFNKDGFVDVVVVNRTMLTVSIMLGTAGGGLGTPKAIPTEYSQNDIQAADFNNDGKLDLVLAIPWSNNFTVWPYLKVLLGNGNGTFNAVPYNDAKHRVYQNPNKIALADFDKDGKIDAATTKASGEWSSMRNLGGELAQKASYDTNDGTLSTGSDGIAAGDFDGDGKIDVAVAERLANEVYFFFGIGDGTFTAGPEIIDMPDDRSPTGLGAGDFDGDGKADLAIITQNDYGTIDPLPPLKIALSEGSARTFAAPVDYGEMTSPTDLQVRDMDGDGRLDVVVADSSSVRVFVGAGDGSFEQKTFAAGAIGPLDLAIADFDRDGGPDIVATEFGPGKVAILLNTCGRVTLNLTSSANPAPQGSPVTITGTVVSPPAVAATGTLTLKRGTTVLDTRDLNAGNSLQATLDDLTPATYAFSAEYSGDSRFAPSTATLNQVVTIPPFGPPPGLNAVSFGGPVQLAWIATAGTDHYEVWRSNGAGWVFAGNAPAASFSDGSAPSSAALLYKVRAISPAGVASDFGDSDLALTYAFTDATLTPGITPIKAAHLTELRSAANAVRAIASLGAKVWAEPSPSLVRASHLTELRAAIAAAREALGLDAVSYTDPVLAIGMAPKSQHFEELRNAMR